TKRSSMFSVFERKPAGDKFQTGAYDLAAPLPRAIAVTADLIDRKRDRSRHWASEARDALNTGDLGKYMGFLVLARKTAEEAAALMESADLLHEEILNRAC